MRKLRLRWQIGLTIAIGVLLIAHILALFPYFQLRVMGIRDLEQEMGRAALELHTAITADLDEGISLVAVSAKLLSEKQSSVMRSEVIDMFMSAMSQTESVLGLGVVYEPNAFDGADSLYHYAKGANYKGQFCPYISRDANRNARFDDTLVNYKKDTPDSWYFNPKRTGEMYVTDPYVEPVFNRTVDTLMFTIAAPIMRAKTFVGVVQADIAMGAVAQRMKDANTFDGLVTTTIYSPSHKMVFTTENTTREQRTEFEDLDKELNEQDLEQLRAGYRVIHDTKENIDLFEPLTLGASTRPIILRFHTQKSRAYASVNREIIPIIGVSIALSLLLSLVLVLIILRLLRPLHTLATSIVQIADGDLRTERLVVRNANDELGRISTSFNRMVDRLRPMLESLNLQATGLDESSVRINSSSTSIASLTGRSAASAEEIQASCASVLEICKHDAASSITARNESVDATTKLQQLADSIQETNKRLSEIIASEQLLSEISSQTNILALNAAVEAARAGDAGRGFSVVATEVRKLAERSATVVKNIQELGTSSMNASKATFVELEALQKAMGNIGGSVQGLESSSAQIAEAVGQIVEAINHLSVNVQTNAATAVDLTQESKEIVERAKELRDQMSFFKV